MKANKHSQAIPQEVLAQAQAKIEEVANALKPYLLALTPKERHDYFKMGEKSYPFVDKAYEFATANPNLVPSFFDMSDYDADYQDARGLRLLRKALEQLFQGVDDTVMVAGAEALQASLAFYANAKSAAAQDVPGAKAVSEDLRKRFPSSRRKVAADEP